MMGSGDHDGIGLMMIVWRGGKISYDANGFTMGG